MDNIGPISHCHSFSQLQASLSRIQRTHSSSSSGRAAFDNCKLPYNLYPPSQSSSCKSLQNLDRPIQSSRDVAGCKSPKAAVLRWQQRTALFSSTVSKQAVTEDHANDSQLDNVGDVEREDVRSGRTQTLVVEAGAVAGAFTSSMSSQVAPHKEHLSVTAAEVVKDTSPDTKVGPGCFLERMPQSKQVYLFYCSETAELARKIAAESDNIVLRTVNWGLFADGFPDLFIVDAHDIRSRHVAFLASFSSPAVIFEQLSIIYALPRMFVASFTLVLPFFPTGTSERIEDEGDIATAFTLARIVSNIPMSRGGPTSVVIFDIHALQERFYFGDSVLPYFESGIPLLKQQLQMLPDADNVSIAYPDEGAWKRFYKQLQDYPTIVCTKVRDGSKRIVKLKEGEPAGRHIVIVDDLVQSGGTLLECQKVLSALGAKRVSAYATHGVFPKRSWARFVHDHGDGPEHGLAHFWITDSCPLTVQQVHGRPPFEVLSLAAPIASALQI